MSIQDYNSLNDLHMDVLREICNIGSGNAATALSQMFSLTVDIEVPDIELMECNAAINDLGGAEAVMTSLLLPVSGELNGMLMFIMDIDFARVLLRALMGLEVNSFDEIDEIGFSAIQEMGNIAAASFVNAIADMTNMLIDIAPPSSTVDMVGAIMNVPAVYCANISDKVFMIKNKFICNNEASRASILLIPDIDSLELLMTRLGIEI